MVKGAKCLDTGTLAATVCGPPDTCRRTEADARRGCGRSWHVAGAAQARVSDGPSPLRRACPRDRRLSSNGVPIWLPENHGHFTVWFSCPVRPFVRALAAADDRRRGGRHCRAPLRAYAAGMEYRLFSDPFHPARAAAAVGVLAVLFAAGLLIGRRAQRVVGQQLATRRRPCRFRPLF